MNIPLRITIHKYGSRPHQTGHVSGDGGGFHPRTLRATDAECPYGPVIEHVRDGKPVTPLGRKLMGVKGC